MNVVELAETPRLLVALDFDGTLAPLVDEPMTARMARSAAEAVDALVRAPGTTVAFVSGRSLADLRIIAEHTDSSPVLLAGSHGAEWWVPRGRGVDGEFPDSAHAGADDDAAVRRETQRRDELAAEAEAAVAHIDGAWVERKAFGFGVHSRTVASDAAAEVHRIVDALVAEQAPQWRRREGHSITEYAFRSEGKDTAIARLRALTAATAVLFAGDDITDEDAIRSLVAGDLGIRVGAGETAASMRVTDIEELAGVLRALAHQRTVRAQ